MYRMRRSSSSATRIQIHVGKHRRLVQVGSIIWSQGTCCSRAAKTCRGSARPDAARRGQLVFPAFDRAVVGQEQPEGGLRRQELLGPVLVCSVRPVSCQT